MKQFNDDLIPEYAEYKAMNGSKFTWWSYVNMKSDLQAALGFVKLFYPEIVNVDGYFILKDKFNEKILNQWKAEKMSVSEVEKMTNLYEVADFFHMNKSSSENTDKMVHTFGESIRYFWNQSFAERFPDRKIKVDLFEEYGTLFITVYSCDIVG